jgi:hypothetical protein
MVIGVIIADFELLIGESLKGRRRIVNSMKGKLKKFNVGVLDISGSYAKEGSLGIVFPAHDSKQAHQIADTIEEFLISHFPEVNFYFDREII